MGSSMPEESRAATPQLAIENADLRLGEAFRALCAADDWLSGCPAGAEPTAEQEHRRERMRDEIDTARRAVDRARKWAIHAYMRDTLNQDGGSEAIDG